MTPLGGIVTGVIVLLALEFLSHAFQYIPAAALGAVIIMAVINLFDFAAMKHIWHINSERKSFVFVFKACFRNLRTI